MLENFLPEYSSETIPNQRWLWDGIFWGSGIQNPKNSQKKNFWGFSIPGFLGMRIFGDGDFSTKKPPLIPNSENMIGIPTLSSEMMFLANN